MSVRWGNPVPLVAVIYCTHPQPRTDDGEGSPRVCPLCGVTMGGPRLPDQERVEVRGL